MGSLFSLIVSPCGAVILCNAVAVYLIIPQIYACLHKITLVSIVFIDCRLLKIKHLLLTNHFDNFDPDSSCLRNSYT